MKDSFILYKSFYKPIAKLSNEQLGKLFRAIFEYQINGIEEVDEDIEIPFGFFLNQMVLDNDKYLEKCNKNKENGSKGGRPKKTEKANGYFGNPNDNENDNDNDNENDNIPPNPPKGNEEVIDLFNLFWKSYPRKVSKGQAEKWFKKNKPTKELVDTMISKINLLKETEQWKKDDGQFIPYPATWLNAKGWEDEVKTKREENVDDRAKRILGNN